MSSAPTSLDEYFDRTIRFAELHQSYRARGVDLTLDESEKEMDGSFDHYISVGADAVRLCVQALIATGRDAPRTILDFPSGSGRVTRHLTSFFPEARVVACDLYEEHVEFCRSTFGTDGVLSNDDLSLVRFDDTFDLIFCGSLLTHFPRAATVQALDLIIRSLSDNGVAVVTTHGRRSIHIQHNETRYLPPKRFRKVELGYKYLGYGYNDYDGGFRSVFSKNARYGISVFRSAWLLRTLERFEDIRVVSYTERGWDRHQDVVVIGRPSAFQP